MYKIIFYETPNGESDVRDFFDNLFHTKGKDARIQYEQFFMQVELLKKRGTNLPENITKHIDEDIWELRPGHNRIFYFCWLDDTFVLLHHFRKTTQKTPRREIEKAKRERDDYLRRIQRE
ncbi:MAG: type II toxin-antitoxin system RelE/ParE family toxin [Synergistaceae bacterium]|nr:type II toxin-antitoxin system RelE/ParE family toxin [Synergistaceae bacterium]